jgi:simple sugar transport system ATP-binding protein
MTGHEPRQSPPTRRFVSEEPLLQVEGLSKTGQFHNVDFGIGPGEVVGLAGLRGSGRTELALSLFGLNPPDAGQIRVDGQPQRIRRVQDAVRLGIGLLPEDRAVEGLVMSHSVGRNAVLAVVDRLRSGFGLLAPRRLRDAMSEVTDAVRVRAASLDVPAQTLSGGNQQRLVLAKWLATRPRLLILHGPTIGIDIAAKTEIHRMIRDLAASGIGMLVISDEIPELLNTCDRVLLMTGGTITHQWQSAEVTESEIQTQLVNNPK